MAKGRDKVPPLRMLRLYEPERTWTQMEAESFAVKMANGRPVDSVRVADEGHVVVVLFGDAQGTMFDPGEEEEG